LIRRLLTKAMGGRGEISDQKIRATQDQLRLARITQDVSSVDDDRANVQKLIKKVIETTRCTVSQAEIALYDTDNNVEEAVNAILEETYSDESVWKEQKSRRAKRAEAEERAEEFSSAYRNRNHLTRNANNFSGSGRGRGSERGRGGFRGGVRGGGRGAYNGRGGYQQPGARSNAIETSNANVWDNSNAQLSKVDLNKEWTNAASNNSVDDIPEDTDWKTAGTLVFSRRDDATPPVAATTPTANLNAAGSGSRGSVGVSMGSGACSASSAAGPISFAAVLASKGKDNSAAASIANSNATANTNAVITNSGNQSNLNSLYQRFVLLHLFVTVNKETVSVSTSGQQGGVVLVQSQDGDGERGVVDEECASTTSNQQSQINNGASNKAGINTSVDATMQRTVNMNSASSADWTAQLKNDLGIGSTVAVAASKPIPTSKPQAAQSQAAQSQSNSHSKQLTMQQHATTTHPLSHTVEFVSGGDSNGPSALPEYQFGFHVETTTTSNAAASVATDEPRSNEDVVFNTTNSKQRSINRATSNRESELQNETSTQMLSNGAVGDFSPSISSQQQQQSKVHYFLCTFQNVVTSNGGVGIVSATPVSHPSAGAAATAVPMQPRQSVPSGLSYTDTSSMSYPSSETRNAIASKPSLSLHQQQQAQHQLYTATQIPYNSYPYLNMYSPVAGVRQDETQYAAAALVQYPFGVGQIDMSSLSTILPPAAAALASQQQAAASQPPPPVQAQHQQRPDQHASYVDLKQAYAAAAAVANSTAAVASVAAAGGGSTLLGGNQPPPQPQAPQAAQQQSQRDTTSAVCTAPSAAVAPPPGFSGPPSNMPTAAFTLPQPNHLSSLFQVYGGHQQMDKYGASNAGKDRLGGGAQATPPPQMYQPPAPAPQGYLSQQMPLHAHAAKKTYANGPQHWSAS
uniref:Protein lingerer n=1 Tax=Anisakis simplex TaxID=6269 RepID=A0A0M3JTW3_ANISI